jgi:hypothetical protein
MTLVHRLLLMGSRTNAYLMTHDKPSTMSTLPLPRVSYYRSLDEPTLIWSALAHRLTSLSQSTSISKLLKHPLIHYLLFHHYDAYDYGPPSSSSPSCMPMNDGHLHHDTNTYGIPFEISMERQSRDWIGYGTYVHSPLFDMFYSSPQLIEFFCSHGYDPKVIDMPWLVVTLTRDYQSFGATHVAA